MPDHATSSSPAVQAQLDRLTALSPGADILGLERITALLSRLGDPHLSLPPVFHVAGTNGKGSTCAFLRAAIEAAGYSVHVYSSPHLVRFNERIRLAGSLIEDDALAALLAEVLDHATDLQASFFEVTTAAAFLAFARTPAASSRTRSSPASPRSASTTSRSSATPCWRSPARRRASPSRAYRSSRWITPRPCACASPPSPKQQGRP
jgi:hypothetical protein